VIKTDVAGNAIRFKFVLIDDSNSIVAKFSLKIDVRMRILRLL